MTTGVHAFDEDMAPAGRLALALGVGLHPIALHRFPDGESLPTVAGVGDHVIIYRSLDRPDGKLMALLLAGDALRRAGAGRLTLVAPYMPYLRQDAVFAPGQPLSRDVLGAVIGERFDAIVTVDPHLHRTDDLVPVFGGRPVAVLSSAAAFADVLGATPDTVVLGPDSESARWASALATALAAPFLTLAKTRSGDRLVDLALPDPPRFTGRRVVVVDDICSSGATLLLALQRLREAGAGAVDLAIVHALFDAQTDGRLRAAGARRIVSTDSCAHATNQVRLAPLLARTLAGQATKEGTRTA
jgi:ribose-phosphate pyrophosphokinase